MRRDGQPQAQNQQNHQRETPENAVFPNNLTNSDVARQAHNLKVVGSNPTPATNFKGRNKRSGPCF